jgi:hypothetical protein
MQTILKASSYYLENRLGKLASFLRIISFKAILILPSLKQTLIHRLSRTKSRCLTNTPMRFGDRRGHLQGAPPQLLTF